MAEKHLWATLHRYTKKHGHFIRIENMIGSGMPDVSYAIRTREGLIELKQIEAWPVRPETPVAVPHYTAQQRIWHRQRLAAGGKVWVLLEIAKPVPVYLLFKASWARMHLGIDATQAACEREAVVYGAGKFPGPELVGVLSTWRDAT